MWKHGTKTTLVFLPANGKSCWSLLPSLLSLLSGGTVQPENTYSCILNVTGQVWESQKRISINTNYSYHPHSSLNWSNNKVRFSFNQPNRKRLGAKLVTGKSVIQVFLINRSATVKLSLINIIHVKTTTKRWLFHFQVYSKIHVRLNKIHARQCLYVISFYCREGSISLLYPKKSFKCNFKTARKKRFFSGATSNWFLFVTR